jgi:hypothetical protein
VQQQETDYLGVGFAGFGTDLFYGIVQGGVAGVRDLPIGVAFVLEQQLYQFVLAATDGSSEENLVACLLVYDGRLPQD